MSFLATKRRILLDRLAADSWLIGGSRGPTCCR
jgi:hypothetical protein